MATTTEIIASARYKLADWDKRAFTDPELLDYLNEGCGFIHKLLIKYGSDLVQSSTDIAGLTGIDNYDLPASYWATAYFQVDGETDYLTKGYQADLVRMPAADYPGTPKLYIIRNTKVYLRPVPDADVTIYHIYYPKWTNLALAVDMPFNDLFSDVIKQFLVMMALNRDEYNIQTDSGFYAILEKAAKDVHIQRMPPVTLDFWAGGEAYDPFDYLKE